MYLKSNGLICIQVHLFLVNNNCIAANFVPCFSENLKGCTEDNFVSC